MNILKMKTNIFKWSLFILIVVPISIFIIIGEIIYVEFSRIFLESKIKEVITENCKDIVSMYFTD
jgi:hypothetical protein